MRACVRACVVCVVGPLPSLSPSSNRPTHGSLQALDAIEKCRKLRAEEHKNLRIEVMNGQMDGW